MRLLHVSDWHLGRVTGRQARTEDHKAVIEEMVTIAREQQPDLVLHTGDLFDHFYPAVQDMHLALDGLQEIAKAANAPVVVICGNHESPALFELFARMAGPESSIRYVAKPLPPARGGILEFPAGNEEVIRVAPVPFVHANRVVSYFEDSSGWMAAYADRLNDIMDRLGAGLLDDYQARRDVLVMASHLYVTGAKPSWTEKPIHVTETYAARLERLPAVSYAAFGHIHKPQALPGTDACGQYAGSPLQLDFGEENEQKSVVLVEAKPGRPAEVTPIPLTRGRPLKTLKGTLDDLRGRQKEASGALCRVIVKTELPLSGLADLVAEALPGAVLLEVTEDCAATRVEALTHGAADPSQEVGFGELFREFISERGTKGADAKRVLSAFDELMRADEAGEEPSFPDEQLLKSAAATEES